MKTRKRGAAMRAHVRWSFFTHRWYVEVWQEGCKTILSPDYVQRGDAIHWLRARFPSAVIIRGTIA